MRPTSHNDERAFSAELHAAFRACPAAIGLLGAGFGTARLDGVRERLLGLLDRSGLPPVERLRAQDALVAHAIGDVVVLHSHSRSSRGAELARRRALPPGEFPQLVQVASLDPVPSPAATYELGLDALLGAIGRLAAR